MKKLLLISLTFGASWVSLFADPLQLDKLGTTVFNVREYPFRKPPVPASTTSLQAVASESNLLFKDLFCSEIGFMWKETCLPLRF